MLKEQDRRRWLGTEQVCFGYGCPEFCQWFWLFWFYFINLYCYSEKRL